MTKRRWPQVLSISVVFAGLIVVVLLTNKPRLQEIHQTVLADYENVNHISVGQLNDSKRDNLMIFDVREDSEFLVSHMDGAILVEPGISAEEFMNQYGDQIVGKTVVFYCSVGRRSSALASRLAAELPESSKAFNLIGGLFQWHNEGGKLMDMEGETTNAIHPYNRYWGQLINDKSAIQYSDK
ncbi:rhodanese-like domain-containing protein [Porticoccus sp. GXU_MW_L64]